MRHPDMQPGWIDAPHRSATLGRFALESGEHIDDLLVSYVVHGDIGDRARPVVLGLCAIGSTHHRLDFLIGEARAFDPQSVNIIVVDALGNGLSSSPSNALSQGGERFPRFTIRDMVKSQKALLDHLGIDEVAAVVGASMGGMQALQWGVTFPRSMRKLVALTPMAKTTPWSQAINHAGRSALSKSNGDWSAWLAVMQIIAMRTPERFADDAAKAGSTYAWLDARAAWWATQRADPLDWIAQSHAYDTHDVGTTPGFDGDTAKALAAIAAPTLVCVPALDLYNPVEAGVWAAEHIPQATLLRLPCTSGHMMASEADPQAAAQLNDAIAEFMR
ncbi:MULTISPECIES: alpha/beta fold hydrolase [unclassified Caballeronia]|uniref:alpha/beta fold hydrolase n=1 Tax=unclassified Caballeronia TaxID=2646786 RepID=UPI00285AF45F|nr:MULTISPECIES: alpha/beta fold hydrolase [unclassified Caballeronia]MDR5773854.1 alpha/beta fold hydrolase [Caballeronia sp. LZ002]MDR5849289.1 alpha/beta fold hydrolase [Caballeronia sp. LZ003]